MEESATFVQMFFNLILWMCIFLITQRAFRYPYINSKSNRITALLLILIFCLYPFFGGDYFHYKHMYNEYKMGGFIPLENIYKWIIEHIAFSYLFFRLLVWGTALAILVKAYKRLDVPFDLCLALFASMFLIWFSYARVSLAMAMILLGLALVVKPYKRLPFISFVFGLCIIFCAEFCHRSAIIGILAALGSLFLINADKKKIVLIGILFPLAIFLLTNILNEFMMLDLDYDSYVSINQRDGYLGDADAGRHTRGLGELISHFLTRTPIFLTAVLYVYLIFRGKFLQMPKTVRCISSYAFIIVLIALAFSFDLGYNTYVFYYRTLTFAMIPSAVFIASVKANRLENKLTNLIIVIGVLGVFYTLIYSTYCAIVA